MTEQWRYRTNDKKIKNRVNDKTIENEQMTE